MYALADLHPGMEVLLRHPDYHGRWARVDAVGDQLVTVWVYVDVGVCHQVEILPGHVLDSRDSHRSGLDGSLLPRPPAAPTRGAADAGDRLPVPEEGGGQFGAHQRLLRDRRRQRAAAAAAGGVGAPAGRTAQRRISGY